MNKLPIILFVFLLTYYNSYSQEGFDPGTPTSSPFQLGSDIQGTIQNSVNEVTGKVTFSAPLASIAARSVSYGVNLTYNGEVAFKNGQQTNKYNPTSVVGVGWGLSTPKIVVDNKQTGTRDDDVFYLQDGATNTKLICIDRGATTNGSAWEFQMEKYAPWKIYFYYHTTWGDYWKIIKDNGQTYYFGNQYVKDGKEFAVRYGNWIGSSKQSGATSEQTIVWNITKIEDQWNNNVTFTYDMVKQTMSGKDQTEAAYLSNIWSSDGAHIQLTYSNKNSDEYYEPHQEASEPDAYQERYEKKHLQSISSYNNENQLVSTYNIGYMLNGTGLNKKRYLTSLTQTAYNNGLSETLPAQIFEYHYTGTFKGGIKKITYPTGGSVTYNYKEKELFTNNANIYASSLVWPSGYGIHSKVVKDNYSLYLLRTNNPITGNKHRFKIFRFWWNGEVWEHDEYTFPHLIDEPDHFNTLIDFQAVFQEDFYGFVYDKGSTADVYLFHIENNGRSWHSYTSTSRSIGSGYPSLLSGNGFAALGAKHDGQLYTYLWNGTSWNYKLISQGSGREYFIAANNNFIVSLDENGGGDMVTGLSYSDNYYIHYLDAEKKWQTKSWSAAADPFIGDIWISSNHPGKATFYPSNSIAGLVAKDNPEYLLRWDVNYNLSNVDNVFGERNDSNPIVGIANSMFTIYDHITKRPYKTVRFNGAGWSHLTPIDPNQHSYIDFGVDFFSFVHSSGRKYYNYNPNTNSWTNGSIYLPPSSHMPSNYPPDYTTSINSNFLQVGHKFFEKSTQGGSLFAEIGSLDNYAINSKSDGLYRSFVFESGDPIDFTERGKYYYIDKNDGMLKYISQNEIKFPTNNFSFYGNFGGRNQFMSPKSICLVSTDESEYYNNLKSTSHTYLHRVINDKLNSMVYDIVVNHIDINDDNGSLRKVQYTYNKPKSTPDNSATFYGEVIAENKGAGTGNIGKVVKVFNDGSDDLTMVGLPLEVLTIDSNNALVKKNTYTWNKYTKSFSNGSHYFYNSYYIRQTKEKEELFFNGSPNVVSETTNTYNTYGLKTSSYTNNSKGRPVREDISYAYQQYTFLNDRNMLAFPYQVTSKINNQVVSVERSNWVEVNGKVYIDETSSGPTTSSLRVNSKISQVEATTGNVLESNNGKGLYKSVLFGYDNLYEIATIDNAKYQDVVDELDVTYAQLQTLSTSSLKTELLKLYDRLPDASITLTFYDINGRVTSRIDNRKDEAFIYYDTVGREDYITDGDGTYIHGVNNSGNPAQSGDASYRELPSGVTEGVYSWWNYATSVGEPSNSYGAAVGFGKGASGSAEIWAGWTNGRLFTRFLRDCCQGWSAWNEIWTANTDGSGSGLDADTVDGLQPVLVQNSGFVGIGTASPDMKLTVDGKIHAEEVKVDLNVPAPDYVFKDDYNLRPLKEVENYIQEYSHLPEIPSAKAFERDGVMLAEMDMSLLKKVEELTLYTIQQEKKLDKQAKEIEELKSLVHKLLEYKK